MVLIRSIQDDAGGRVEGRRTSHATGVAAPRERIKSHLPLRVTSALKGVRSSVRAIRWPARSSLAHTLPSGLRVEVSSPSDWAVYNEVFVDGEYDPVIDAVIESPHGEPWILNVGANIGLFTPRPGGSLVAFASQHTR